MSACCKAGALEDGGLFIIDELPLNSPGAPKRASKITLQPFVRASLAHDTAITVSRNELSVYGTETRIAAGG